MRVWAIVFLVINGIGIVYFPIKYFMQWIFMKLQYIIVSFGSLNRHAALKQTVKTMETNTTTIYNNQSTITINKANNSIL